MKLQSPQKETAFLKSQLRKQLQKRRKEIQPFERKQANEAILFRLSQLDIFQSARTIHTYVAWRDEVNNHELIRNILQQGRKVVTPKVKTTCHELEHYFIKNFNHLQPGAFGILEPQPDSVTSLVLSYEIFDLILVPGLAFDQQGNRLGYGSGHYDRFLKDISAPTIGLAFSSQVVTSIPVEEHDCKVDFILTEHEVIRCNQE